MNQTEATNMQSYPSPNAVAAGSGGPFYSNSSNQQQLGLTSPEELQLAAQLSRGLAPIMDTGPGGGMSDSQDPRGQGNVHHQYEQDTQNHGGHSQLNHGPMDQMGSQYGAADGSMAPRKRSKVSRACDECRRKKIRCDATGEPGDEQCSSCKRVGTRCQFSRVPMKRGPSKGYIKELADRLNTLEGAMQAGEIPVPQYLPHHGSPVQRRGSDEFSPPPSTENPQRKRDFSAVSGDFNTPYQPQRPPAGWASQEPPRHLPHPSPAFATPQSAPPASQIFREPNYSPNGLQPLSHWRNPPEQQRPQVGPFENVAPVDQNHAEHSTEWDEGIIDGYYEIIHPTYPILSQTKTRLSSRLANCPASLREAFFGALHSAVKSFSSQNQPHLEQQTSKKASQLILSSIFEGSAVRNLPTNLICLQAILLMVIEGENHGTPKPRSQGGPSRSVLLGSAVGLAYSMQLHLHKQPDKVSESDPDSDDKLARRIWWSLVIMDRWHASSTSSPLLIPDGSVIVYPEDQVLLGDSVYHLARLSIVLGHFSAVALVPTDLPALSVPSAPLIGTLLRGELERCRESFPASFFPPSNAPLIHLCYWHLRILMELRLPESDSYELLVPAMHIVTQLTHNSGLVSTLTHHSTTLAAVTLIELTSYENTKEEAEKGLQSLLDNHIAPSSWDSCVRDMILKKRQSGPALVIPVAVPAPTPAGDQHAVTASQGLQRLADLATATEGRSDVSAVPDSRQEVETSSSRTGGGNLQRFHDLRELVRTGYLNAMSGCETKR